MFTKGEWRYENAYGVPTKEGGLIVEALQSDHSIVIASICAHDNAEANAQLIASAPDLYEALKVLKSRFRTAALMAGLTEKSIESKLGETVRALAKAEGN